MYRTLSLISQGHHTVTSRLNQTPSLEPPSLLPNVIKSFSQEADDGKHTHAGKSPLPYNHDFETADCLLISIFYLFLVYFYLYHSRLQCYFFIYLLLLFDRVDMVIICTLGILFYFFFSWLGFFLLTDYLIFFLWSKYTNFIPDR